MDLEIKSKIFYYFREKYYNLMLMACSEGISKFKGDVSFHLFQSLGLMLVNRLEEGIHDLEAIRGENDVKLAVTIALMYGNKLLGNTNKELYQQLDNQMRDYRKQADAIDFYHSGFVLVAMNKYEKALDYVEKSLNIQSLLVESQSLKGWILMNIAKKRNNLNVIQEMFDNCLTQNPRYLDGMLGLSECYLLQNNFVDALNIVNKAVVRFNKNPLPLLQKLRIFFAQHDYDQIIETEQRIPNDLECLKIDIIIALAKDGDYEKGTKLIRNFIVELEKNESNNSEIFLETSKIFSRISNRNCEILNECIKMLEIALQYNSDNIEVIIELGNQNICNGKLKEALRYFKSATKIDETNLNALLGLSFCEFYENGKSDQLNNQILFLQDLKDSNKSVMLHFLQAKTVDNSQESLKHLDEIIAIQTAKIKNLPYSPQYLLQFNPDFMLDVVKEYLQHNTDNILEILKIIVEICPGLTEGLYLLAKLEYLNNDINNALITLEQLLNKTEMTEAHLLMAQIQIKNNHHDRAAQSLEMAVSNNFRVRENPLYHYSLGLVDKNSQNYPDAVKSLTTALTLININNNNLTLSEKASIYVELIDTLNLINQIEEAEKILNDATEDLKGTVEESRILLLSAEHALNRKNVQAALDLLSRIDPKESCYLEGKQKHAEILLKFRHDKFAFVQCYKDLVAENPGSDTYVLLGDAYMKILEPDDALECYEKALKLNQHDSALISKFGKALIDTHYFNRAVSYYKEMIEVSNDSELKLQLAELYLNLNQYEKGELLLIDELENLNTKSEDLRLLQFKSRLLGLLSQIQEKSGSAVEALRTLKDALDNQNRVRKRLAVEGISDVSKEVNAIVELAVKLGDLAISMKNNEKAIDYYKDGLDVSPNNITILVALAKLYMQMNFLELCQQTCSTILRFDPENEHASVMMADIAFRKVDFDMALFHFTQLISKQPTNWDALARLIEILRRTGNIDDCSEFIKSAEMALDNPLKDTSFLYCKALYEWYSGNLNSALKDFNSARQDSEFGQAAIYNMIEICLNPDDEMFAEQFSDSDDIEYRDSRSMALKTADRLLKELKQRLESSGDDLLKYRILANFRLLATKDKYNVERALDDFVAIASQNVYKDNIGTILGMSTAYTLLKQGQRAKNQLKRVVKTTWTFEDAEYLERCWLLLADYYVQSTKFDIAVDLINRVVQHNKACMKAYEYLGFIAEKEQRYKDATGYYDSAWKFGGKSNPGVGFKLSYCLLKSKRYPDAIDTAQEVLKINPDYPRVKKDILDKAMNNLRI